MNLWNVKISETFIRGWMLDIWKTILLFAFCLKFTLFNGFLHIKCTRIYEIHRDHKNHKRLTEKKISRLANTLWFELGRWYFIKTKKTEKIYKRLKKIITSELQWNVRNRWNPFGQCLRYKNVSIINSQKSFVVVVFSLHSFFV